MDLLRQSWDVLFKAITQFIEDDAEKHGAALAFYALFTVGPLLVIATAVAGLVFGEEAAAQKVSAQLETLLTPEAAVMVERMVAAASQPQSNLTATVVGVITLVFGSTRAFAQLQNSLDTVWNVERTPQPPARAIGRLLLKRLLSLVAVLAIGLFLAVSLVASVVVSFVSVSLAEATGLTVSWIGVVDSTIDFVLLTVFMALVYKTFPDVDVAWPDVALGSTVTAALMVLGQGGFSFYVSHTAVTSGYGPAGSLVAVMLLAYLAALAFLFGAELTQVWAEHRGRPIQPTSRAVRLRRRRRHRKVSLAEATEAPTSSGR